MLSQLKLETYVNVDSFLREDLQLWPVVGDEPVEEQHGISSNLFGADLTKLSQLMATNNVSTLSY